MASTPRSWRRDAHERRADLLQLRQLDDRALDPYNVLWVDLFNSAAAGRNGNSQVSSITDNTNGSTLGGSDVLDGFRYAGGTNVSALSAVNGTGVSGQQHEHVLEAHEPVVDRSRIQPGGHR